MILFWDICCWILILFPLFTGGIWFSYPGFKLELTQITIPVVILSVWAFVVHLKYKNKYNLQDASSFIFFKKLFLFWHNYLQRNAKTALWLGSLFFGILFSLASLKRHWAFGTHAGDLGIFTSAIWNLTHGFGYVSSFKGGINLFTDHQSPIFWVLAPLFYIFPYAETLLIAQALVLSTGGVALYFLALQFKNEKSYSYFLSLLPLMYWGYFPMRNANAFDFHPETAMLPLFLWMVYFLQKNNLKSKVLSIVFLLLTLGTKESAPPLVAALGVAFLCGAGIKSTRRYTQKWGVALILIGIVGFYIDIKWVPGEFGKTYFYSNRFERFGQSFFEILLSPISKPIFFLKEVLFEKNRILFLFGTFLPLAFLPLKKPKFLWVAVPAFLMLFMDEGSHRVQLQYHYVIEPAIGLFLATVVSLMTIEKNQKRWFFIILFCSLVSHGRSELFRIRKNEVTSHHLWLKYEVVPYLAQTSFSVSGALAPHVANRHWVHHLPVIEMPIELTGQSEVECVVIDEEINNFPLDQEGIDAFKKELITKNYRLEYQCERFYVFKKEKNSGKCLTQQPNCTGNHS